MVFTDGWSRETCLRWFTAIYKWRSAGTDRAMHCSLASSQNHSWTQTSKHKHKSVHAAADRAAVENICRGQTPTCQCPSTLCLHFPRESTLAGRHIHSPGLQMQSITLTKTQIWLWFLSVLASFSSGAGPSSLTVSIAGRSSCHVSTPGENTGSPYWAVLNDPTLEPVTY